ncbi:MAG: hypothetical protein KA712_13455 [Myxococcales bacterium]|nr:hypothetical protein [Myxococcales bacterium]
MRWLLFSVLMVTAATSTRRVRAEPPSPPSPVPTRAKSPPPPADQVKLLELLASPGLITPAKLEALGRDADLALIDILRDAAVERALKARAIDALAATGSPVARDHLVRMIATAPREADLVLLRRAFLGIGWLRDGRAVQMLAPWLDHAEPEVRLDAAVALNLTRRVDALEALAARRKREKNKLVAGKLERLIHDLEQALPAQPPPPRQHPRVQPPPPMEGRDRTRL